MEKKAKETAKSPQSRIDLLHHLLNKGTVAYLPSGFEFGHMMDKLMLFLLNLGLEAEYYKDDQLHQVQYMHKSGITESIGLSEGFRIFMLFDQQQVFWDIKPQKWFNSEENISFFSKLINDSHEKEIKGFIFQYLYEQGPGYFPYKLDTRNHFIDPLSEPKKLWFSANLPPEDYVFVFLEISAVKKDNGVLNTDKNLKWYVYFSSSKAGLIAFNQREQVVQQIDIAVDKFRVKKELGRNPVFIDQIKLLSTRSNSELFYHIQDLYKLNKIEKIRDIVRLNWQYKEENEPSNQYAIDLLKTLVAETNDAFDELALLYMEFTSIDRQRVFSEFVENEKLLSITQKILEHPNTHEQLAHWIIKWNISYIDSVAINSLLVKSSQNAVQANNILPFYRFVRERFFDQDSDKTNQIVFDIGFCKHLLKCGLIKEAKKIMEKRLDQIPDETILDILPPKNMDLTDTASGQKIKITILEILAELETEKIAGKLKCKIARLQPLVEERMANIMNLTIPQISAKAAELKNLMMPGGLVIDAPVTKQFRYKPLDKSQIEKYIKHPASRPNGIFSNFQKWLASAKIPDLSVLKSYTEKLSAQKYPELSSAIADIKYALNIEALEVYIAHGEKSVGISSFESNPQFLVVGGDHLDKNSPHYLNPSELRFAVATELAHLYFKHARITSSDLWKGAFEKGYFVVDALLSIFPAVGMFSKSLMTVGKLTQISDFLQKAEKLGKISARSRDIVKSSEQVVSIYNSKFSTDKNENKVEMELLAASRIMQLTAHRCALVFTKDLKAGIRSMFLISRRYYTELPVIEKYGLRDYLLKQDEKGNFRHQELAIRLADLFSFYLSEDYEIMVEKLEST
jgi:hypothetical protein